MVLTFDLPFTNTFVDRPPYGCEQAAVGIARSWARPASGSGRWATRNIHRVFTGDLQEAELGGRVLEISDAVEAERLRLQKRFQHHLSHLPGNWTHTQRCAPAPSEGVGQWGQQPAQTLCSDP